MDTMVPIIFSAKDLELYSQNLDLCVFYWEFDCL